MNDYPDFVVTIDGKQYVCHPVCRQEYRDCYFEAGYIDEHPQDPMYLLLSRNGDETFIYLRPDEVAAIAWVLNGLLWSNAMNEKQVPLLLTLAKDRAKLEIATIQLRAIRATGKDMVMPPTPMYLAELADYALIKIEKVS